jgi:hypothetical protein
LREKSRVISEFMKHLSSRDLLLKAKSLAAEERRVTLALIECLEECQRRMLYAELGYGSLWDFATRELGLSEGAAQRRIQAMRLVRDVPEAKSKLASGALSLSNAAKVQSLRRTEKKAGRKLDAPALVAQVENLSQRECDRKLFEIAPQARPPERERVVSTEGDRELKIVVGPGLHAKLQKLKGFLAHALPEATYEELIDRLTTEALERLEKRMGSKGRQTEENQRTEATGAESAQKIAPVSVHDAAPALTAAAAVATPTSTMPARSFPAARRVALPAAWRRQVWIKARNHCEFVSGDGRRCQSTHKLEIDHIQPLGLGGENRIDNLRLLCRNHNVHSARRAGLGPSPR